MVVVVVVVVVALSHHETLLRMQRDDGPVAGRLSFVCNTWMYSQLENMYAMSLAASL
jgi:hypothetical protein